MKNIDRAAIVSSDSSGGAVGLMVSSLQEDGRVAGAPQWHWWIRLISTELLRSLGEYRLIHRRGRVRVTVNRSIATWVESPGVSLLGWSHPEYCYQGWSHLEYCY